MDPYEELWEEGFELSNPDGSYRSDEYLDRFFDAFNASQDKEAFLENNLMAHRYLFLDNEGKDRSKLRRSVLESIYQILPWDRAKKLSGELQFFFDTIQRDYGGYGDYGERKKFDEKQRNFLFHVIFLDSTVDVISRADLRHYFGMLQDTDDTEFTLEVDRELTNNQSKALARFLKGKEFYLGEFDWEDGLGDILLPLEPTRKFYIEITRGFFDQRNEILKTLTYEEVLSIWEEVKNNWLPFRLLLPEATVRRVMETQVIPLSLIPSQVRPEVLLLNFAENVSRILNIPYETVRFMMNNGSNTHRLFGAAIQNQDLQEARFVDLTTYDESLLSLPNIVSATFVGNDMESLAYMIRHNIPITLEVLYRGDFDSLIPYLNDWIRLQARNVRIELTLTEVNRDIIAFLEGWGRDRLDMEKESDYVITLSLK